MDSPGRSRTPSTCRPWSERSACAARAVSGRNIFRWLRILDHLRIQDGGAGHRTVAVPPAHPTSRGGLSRARPMSALTCSSQPIAFSGATHRHLVLLCDLTTLSEFDDDPRRVVETCCREALERPLQARATLGIVSGRRSRTSSSALRLRRLLRRSPRTRDQGSREHTHPCLTQAQALSCATACRSRDHRWCIPEDKTHALVAHFRADHGGQPGPRSSCATPAPPGRRQAAAGDRASMIELMPNIEWHKGNAVQWILTA
jgi:hypothetical protein